MALEFGQIVLVDTNVILEAHRVGCWGRIAQHFRLHTVEKVVEETQTGYQNRDPETWIDETKLRAAFGCVVEVTDEQRAAFNIAHAHPALDAGERDLLLSRLGYCLAEGGGWPDFPIGCRVGISRAGGMAAPAEARRLQFYRGRCCDST